MATASVTASVTVVLNITFNTIIFEVLRPNKKPTLYTLIYDKTTKNETNQLKANTIAYYKTIQSVLFTFAELLNTFKPSLLIGYGIKRNGFKLMHTTLEELGLECAFRETKRLKYIVETTEFGKETSYMSLDFNCVVIDVFSLLQKKGLSLRSYKLNDVLNDLQLSGIVQLYTYLSTV